MTNIPAGMVPYGPEHPDYPNEPQDWDGGPYLCRDGTLYHMAGYGWKHGLCCYSVTASYDRVAYTPRPIDAGPNAHDAALGLVAHHPVGRMAALGLTEPVDVAERATTDPTSDLTARLRGLLTNEQAAMTAMRESIGEHGADLALLDAWITASGALSSAGRDALPDLLDRIDRLTAERERLREALEELAEAADSLGEYANSGMCDHAMSKARAALLPGDGGEG